MRVVERTGIEPRLPKVALPAVALVHEPRVALVSDGKGRSQALGRTGYEDQMYVIGHQAPCDHLDAGCCAAFSNQFDVAGIVARVEKRRLAPVATLGDVVGNSWNNGSSAARHGRDVGTTR